MLSITPNALNFNRKFSFSLLHHPIHLIPKMALNFSNQEHLVTHAWEHNDIYIIRRFPNHPNLDFFDNFQFHKIIYILYLFILLLRSVYLRERIILHFIFALTNTKAHKELA